MVEADEARDQMVITFEVTAQLVFPNGEREAVRFSTSVDPSSNVQLG